jgi:hypothetical protein
MAEMLSMGRAQLWDRKEKKKLLHSKSSHLTDICSSGDAGRGLDRFYVLCCGRPLVRVLIWSRAEGNYGGTRVRGISEGLLREAPRKLKVEGVLMPSKFKQARRIMRIILYSSSPRERRMYFLLSRPFSVVRAKSLQ